MGLVNWDGALIGPGSEWFWSAAQFIVVTVTLIGIYCQFSAQRSANALQQMNSFNQQWERDRMARTRLQVALHLRNGDGFDALYPYLTEFVTFFGDLADLRARATSTPSTSMKIGAERSSSGGRS